MDPEIPQAGLDRPTCKAVAQAMQIMKSGTSKKIREEYPELEEFLWGDNLWAEGYFAESVVQVTESPLELISRTNSFK